MTIHSGIFNSVSGDRKYNAWWFAKYFSTFIGNGVFPNPSTNLQVASNTNMKVIVKPGSGWIDGYFLYNDSEHVLQLDVADGVLKRIDRVVMRLNHLTRMIEIVVKKGAFASSPVAPVLQRDTDYMELALADIYIVNGTTVITQANITDQRLNNALCGIVHGLVNQVDTTAIFNQYQSWFGTFTVEKQADFDAWIASLQDILDGDVAANLASRITNLEQRFGSHMTTDYEPFKVQFAQHKDDNTHVHWIGNATGTNALVATYAPITAYKDGLGVAINVITDSTVATTLKINGLGVIPIKKSNGTNATLKKGVYTLRYVGGNFHLQGEGGEYGNAVAADVRSTKTIGTDNGLIAGSLVTRNTAQTNVKPSSAAQTLAAGIYDFPIVVSAMGDSNLKQNSNGLEPLPAYGTISVVPNVGKIVAAYASGGSYTSIRFATGGNNSGVELYLQTIAENYFTIKNNLSYQYNCSWYAIGMS